MKQARSIFLTVALMLGVMQAVCAEEKRPQDIDPAYFKAYIADVQKRLNRMGYPERVQAESGTSATITFKIDTNGSASDIVLKSSTGNKTFNDVCLTDVRNRAPFRPFPKKLLATAVYEPLKTTVSIEIDKNK